MAAHTFLLAIIDSKVKKMGDSERTDKLLACENAVLEKVRRVNGGCAPAIVFCY